MTAKSLLAVMITCALILSISMVSAALEVKVNAVPATTLHNQDISVQFNVTNTDTAADLASVTFEGAVNTGSPGSWKTLPSAIELKKSETKQLTAVYNVPAQAKGSVGATFKAKSGTLESNVLILTIPINNTASLTLTNTKDITLAQNGTITVMNTGNVALNNIELSAAGAPKVGFSANNFQLAGGASRTIDVLLTDVSALTFGENALTITAQDKVETAAKNSTSFSTIRKSFCSTGARGTNLTINDVKLRSSGKDDDEWKILDEVTVEVEVENRGTTDLEDVIVQLGLFDSQGRDQVNDLDFDNEDEEKIEINDLDDGDEETVSFKFKVGGDIDDGNYKLTVKVFSKKTGEANLCIDSSDDLSDKIFETIKIEREDDEGKFIAFSNLKFSPSEATCSDTVTLTTEVVNIGDEDQDRVKVLLKSPELKLDLAEELRQGLDIGDDALVSFTFTVPQGLADKSYPLELTAEYDYRSGAYREGSDSVHRVPFKVFGCVVKPQQPSPGVTGLTISAELQSDAQPGKQLVVKSSIRNPITQSPVAALVNIKGYESWAQLKNISTRSLALAPGESKDVTLTFDVNKDATGKRSFTIETTVNDKTQSQVVEVELAKAKTPSLWDAFGQNKLAWLIGIINLILIIVIIIVAVKISQR